MQLNDLYRKLEKAKLKYLKLTTDENNKNDDNDDDDDGANDEREHTLSGETQLEDKKVVVIMHPNVYNINVIVNQNYLISYNENKLLNNFINKPGMLKIRTLLLTFNARLKNEGALKSERAAISSRLINGVAGRVIRNIIIEWQDLVKEKTRITKEARKKEAERKERKQRKKKEERKKREERKRKNEQDSSSSSLKKRKKKNSGGSGGSSNNNNNSNKKEQHLSQQKTKKSRVCELKRKNDLNEDDRNQLKRHHRNIRAISYIKERENANSKKRNFAKEEDQEREEDDEADTSSEQTVNTTVLLKLLDVMNENVFEINKLLTEVIYPISESIGKSISMMEKKIENDKKTKSKALQVLYGEAKKKRELKEKNQERHQSLERALSNEEETNEMIEIEEEEEEDAKYEGLDVTELAVDNNNSYMISTSPPNNVSELSQHYELNTAESILDNLDAESYKTLRDLFDN